MTLLKFRPKDSYVSLPYNQLWIKWLLGFDGPLTRTQISEELHLPIREVTANLEALQEFGTVGPMPENPERWRLTTKAS